MPFHCQKKALLEAGSKLPWEDEREENPHGVSNARARATAKDKEQPPSIKITTKEETVRRKALAATAKFDNEGPSAGQAVLDSNIPGFIDADFSGDDDWKSPFHAFSSDTKLSDADCDFKLSRIFGGVAKAMEGAGDIDGMDRIKLGNKGHTATPYNNKPLSVWVDYDNDGKKGKGEMVKDSDRGGIIHVYTDEKGSLRKDISLYAPGGWVGTPTTYFTGGNSGLIFNYANGITIEFVHTGTGNKNQRPSIPTNPGAGELAEIGYIGGAGGNSSRVDSNGIAYTHTHIVFFSNKARNMRIDPRVLFCGW